MWNECWSCEMSKKKSLPVFFFFIISCFCFLPSTTFPPLSFLDTDKPKCFLASGLKIRWSVCNFAKKNKKKKLSVSSTVLPSPSAALPLPHSLPRSATCTDGERNSHFSSALLRFFESRRISTGDVETLPLSSSHGEIHDTLHPDNLTKSPLCVVYQPCKLSYASKRYNGLGPNAGA